MSATVNGKAIPILKICPWSRIVLIPHYDVISICIFFKIRLRRRRPTESRYYDDVVIRWKVDFQIDSFATRWDKNFETQNRIVKLLVKV